MPHRILLVEDDPAVRRSLLETLQEEGLEVHVAESAEKALGIIASIRPEAVLSDVRLGGAPHPFAHAGDSQPEHATG